MILRPLVTAFALAVAVVASTAAQAEYATNSRYLDPQDPDVVAACRGLEAQSRMSLTSNVPDDIDNGDTSGEYALARLHFTLRDCREAGIR